MRDDNIQNLEVQINADVDDFIKKIDKAKKKVEELKKSLNSLTKADKPNMQTQINVDRLVTEQDIKEFMKKW